jgi:hypothetical protein
MENDLNSMIGQIMGTQPGIESDETGWMNFTPEHDEQKVLEITRKYEAQWKKYASIYEKNLNNCYSLYRNQNLISEGTSTKVPETFALIEIELPHLLNALFGQSSVIDARAKFQDPGEERTYKIKNYINNLIVKVCKGEKKTRNIIKNELIYGTSFIKVWWDNDFDLDINPMDGSVVKINSGHPNFDLVDPYSIAWDTRNQSQDLQQCKWLRERIFINKDEMKVMRDSGECGFFNDDDMTSTQNKGRMRRQKEAGDNVAEEDITYYDEYSCTLYCKNPEGRMEAKEYIIWVLAENKVIKFFENKMQRKMYCMSRAYDLPNELVGLGEPDVMGALASHASYVHFQLGKTIKRVGQSAAILTPDANMSPEELRSIEDGVFYVDDAKGLTFQPSMDPTNIEVLMKSKEYLDKQIQNVTGIGPALQGESIGDVSATEASYVFQNASNRLALKLVSLQQDFMQQLAEMMFLLAKQTLQEPVSFFDTNNNNVSLTPADFLGNYDWEANGSITQANKALQLAQSSQLAQQMIQLVQMSKMSSHPLDFNGMEILSGLVAPYTNTPDLSRYVFPMQVPPPMPVNPNGVPGGADGAMAHAGQVQPNAAGAIQNPGLSPQGVNAIPAAAQLNPQSQTPPRMPHQGHREAAAIKNSGMRTV